MKRPVMASRSAHAVTLAIAIYFNVFAAAADFSDSNWSSMGGVPGADSQVNVAAIDSSGNCYIGGGFGVVGDVVANHIAKWNGVTWTALGSGLNNVVYALATSSNNVFAGGVFTTAGGSPAA